MRASTPLLAGATLLALLSFGVGGCGKPKQADDPSNESTHKPPSDDGTGSTKWEGATTPPPPSETKTAGTAVPGVRAVNEAATRRSDQYDKEATEIVVKRAARQVKENCGAAKDDNGKAVGPWGKATLQIQLGHNGHSKGLTVPAPFQGKPTGNCIEKAFTNLTFPPWAGADTEISWEVELVPAAGEKTEKK
jgi:hypothetical protein